MYTLHISVFSATALHSRISLLCSCRNELFQDKDSSQFLSTSRRHTGTSFCPTLRISTLKLFYCGIFSS